MFRLKDLVDIQIFYVVGQMHIFIRKQENKQTWKMVNHRAQQTTVETQYSNFKHFSALLVLGRKTEPFNDPVKLNPLTTP